MKKKPVSGMLASKNSSPKPESLIRLKASNKAKAEYAAWLEAGMPSISLLKHLKLLVAGMPSISLPKHLELAAQGAALFELSSELQDRMNKFRQKMDENSHHEKALEVLQGALDSARNDPAMTPEIKEIVDLFIELVERRRPFDYAVDTILQPVKKAIINESATHAGKADKKPEEKAAASIMYEEWIKSPNKYKSKNHFAACVVNAKHCKSKTTGLNWLIKFRNEKPDVEIEKLLSCKK